MERIEERMPVDAAAADRTADASGRPGHEASCAKREGMRRREPIRVLGIGAEGPAGWGEAYRRWVEEADVLVGGERQLSFFPDFRGEKWVLKSAIGEVVDRMVAQPPERKIVVLASGDPLFYGIGGLLVKKLGRDSVEIHPHLSSVQLAFARMGESWHDAAFLSVHGRPLDGLAEQVRRLRKVAILTDDVNTPAAVARHLLDAGVDGFRAFVGENLGAPDERCTWWDDLRELAKAAFAPLNVVVLLRKCPDAVSDIPLGIPDEAFAQRKPDKGLITKKEVRVISLAELRIRKDSVVWDIGAGTGSVAIEAARLAPEGQVFAIEKNAEDVANLRENVRRFGRRVTVVHGTAPEGLEAWPDPDAVFIGGTGKQMAAILDVVCARLKPGGRIVLNAATLENLHEAYAGLVARGFAVEVRLVQVARSKPILDMLRLEGLNPVFVLTAYRKEETT
ncbi:bifunctional cobalt-precorrin-7 (C(5))-methyltransferase/cobalt-precorrin-6B (C(15))-methyltransferase [Calditerricola satsumensis]|uniref:Precorrin-6Y-methylase n=2 Tax=Calditerricola satsumensis TaxID=373054 RepID=A0A8J3F8M1_9BACI|nr:precorrin-6Y-methylase [Calditerricola satsumensis]